MSVLTDLLRQSLVADGAVVEIGVGDGTSALEIAAELKGTRDFFAYDTFNGFPLETLIDKENFTLAMNIGRDSTKDVARTLIGRGVFCVFGVFPLTFWVDAPERTCFVHLDGDTYIATRSGLDLFGPRMNSGGVFAIHDYDNRNLSGVKRAVDGFLEKHGEEYERIETDTHLVLVKK